MRLFAAELFVLEGLERVRLVSRQLVSLAELGRPVVPFYLFWGRVPLLKYTGGPNLGGNSDGNHQFVIASHPGRCPMAYGAYGGPQNGLTFFLLASPPKKQQITGYLKGQGT